MGRRPPDHRLTSREQVVALDPAEVVVHAWGDPAASTTVLLWHGLGDDALHARPLATVLAAEFGHHVLAVDAPGFGRSQPLPEAASYHPAELGRMAGELIDRLGLERCAFVGHSWGAAVGCHAGAGAPDRIEALVLLDGGHTELDDWGDHGAAMAALTVADCIALAETRDVRDPQIWGAAVHASFQPPGVASTYGSLRRAGVPVLLLVGDHPAETVGGRAASRGLARFRVSLPDADARIVGGVGHDLPGEAGAAVGRIVGEWLGRYRGSA